MMGHVPPISLCTRDVWQKHSLCYFFFLYQLSAEIYLSHVHGTRNISPVLLLFYVFTQYIMPHPFKNMSAWYKFMYGYDCFVSEKYIYSYLLSWQYRYLKTLKDQICNAQNISSGEMASTIFETYRNYLIPYGCNIYQHHRTCPCLQFVPTHFPNIHYHTLNSCCIVV